MRIKKINHVDSLAVNIRNARKKKKLTAMELGELLGISQVSVSRWENGKAEPELCRLVKLADLLGVTTDELLGRTTAAGGVTVSGTEVSVGDNNRVTFNGAAVAHSSPCAECARKEAVIAELRRQNADLLAALAGRGDAAAR